MPTSGGYPIQASNSTDSENAPLVQKAAPPPTTPDKEVATERVGSKESPDKHAIPRNLKELKDSCGKVVPSMFKKQNSTKKNCAFVELARKGDLEALTKQVNESGGRFSKLTKKQFDCNVQDTKGQTALIAAVARGHKGIMQFLLTKKVDVNIQDGSRRTALHYAVRQKTFICNLKVEHPLASPLIDCKADLEIKDSLGWTALEVAATQRNHSAVFTLQAAGAKASPFVRIIDDFPEDDSESEESCSDDEEDYTDEEEEEEEEGEDDADREVEETGKPEAEKAKEVEKANEPSKESESKS